MNGAHVRAVARLEWRTQRREPLTVLYLLVLSLLAAAFAAAGPVELVRDRGAVPRDSAWSLMMASTALTAFGQVITTMVAATVVLRDRADRVSDQLAVTRLTRREYLTGKLLAVLSLLVLIYAAIPAGMIVGGVLGGGSVSVAAAGALTPFVCVVLPTMLAIGALQFAVGVLSGRLWTIVGLGLVLIWLWTATTGVAGTAGNDALALLDPFASAPLLVATRAWTDAERITSAMPVTTLLVGSRLLWLVIGTGMACAAVMWRVRPVSSASASVRATALIVPADVRSSRGVVRARRMTAWRGSMATATYVARWMLRDAGWRVLTLLGVLNVIVHAAIDVRVATNSLQASEAALLSLQLHARLFLILLATIYAGELVWREREERSSDFFEVAPLTARALHLGRIGGVLVAQCVVVVLLGVAAALPAVMRGDGLAMNVFVGGVLQRVLLPFVTWMLIALVVHLVVEQKVVAHLLCIAGWVLAALRFGAADVSIPGVLSQLVLLLVALVAMTAAVLLWRRGGLRTGWFTLRRQGVT